MIQALLLSSTLGAASVLLAFRLFRRAASGSHEAFLKAFGAVFVVQGLLFAALLGLAWLTKGSVLPLLAPYILITSGGTLAVGLKLKGASGAR